MRVLHILNDLNNHGNGVVNAAIDLALIQAHSGHTVAVASNGGGYEALLAGNNVKHFLLNPLSCGLGTALSIARFNRILNRLSPQIVHCHTVRGLLLTYFCRRKRTFRLVSHIHNVHSRSSRLMYLSDAVIAVSEAVAKAVSFRGIRSRKLHVVENRFIGSLRRSVGGKQHTRTLLKPAIVCVAGLNRRKNIDGLILAFTGICDMFPSAHLYLVGDGPNRAEFEALAGNSPFKSRIHFEGFQSDPQSYMKAADIFVLASHRDSSPLVLDEAREAGAAVIATRVDGIPEALDYGRAGILVEPGDKQALMDAFISVLSDPAEQLKWKIAASSCLEQRSIQRTHAEVLMVYTSLLRQLDIVRETCPAP